MESIEIARYRDIAVRGEVSRFLSSLVAWPKGRKSPFLVELVSASDDDTEIYDITIAGIPTR